MTCNHPQAHSNGYMTLPTTGSVRSYSYNPSALSGVRGDPLIAAYWADVDLRGVGAVHYRETCSSADLNAAATHIRCRYGGSYRPTSAVVTTWEGVGYYGRHTNKVYGSNCDIEDSASNYHYDDHHQYFFQHA